MKTYGNILICYLELISRAQTGSKYRIRDLTCVGRQNVDYSNLDLDTTVQWNEMDKFIKIIFRYTTLLVKHLRVARYLGFCLVKLNCTKRHGQEIESGLKTSGEEVEKCDKCCFHLNGLLSLFRIHIPSEKSFFLRIIIPSLRS